MNTMNITTAATKTRKEGNAGNEIDELGHAGNEGNENDEARLQRAPIDNLVVRVNYVNCGQLGVVDCLYPGSHLRLLEMFLSPFPPPRGFDAKFIYRGQELDKRKTFAFYGIANEDVIDVVWEALDGP